MESPVQSMVQLISPASKFPTATILSSRMATLPTTGLATLARRAAFRFSAKRPRQRDRQHMLAANCTGTQRHKKPEGKSDKNDAYGPAPGEWTVSNFTDGYAKKRAAWPRNSGTRLLRSRRNLQ